MKRAESLNEALSILSQGKKERKTCTCFTEFNLAQLWSECIERIGICYMILVHFSTIYSKLFFTYIAICGLLKLTKNEFVYPILWFACSGQISQGEKGHWFNIIDMVCIFYCHYFVVQYTYHTCVANTE